MRLAMAAVTLLLLTGMAHAQPVINLMADENVSDPGKAEEKKQRNRQGLSGTRSRASRRSGAGGQQPMGQRARERQPGQGAGLEKPVAFSSLCIAAGAAPKLLSRLLISADA